MKLCDIILKLEELAPPHISEEWDNVGLMVGSNEREIKNAVVVLDVTMEAVLFAVENGCELIVSHHPFILPKLTSIDLDTEKGKMAEILIKNDISVYSMHTNFDTAEGGVNDVLFEKFSLSHKEVSGMLRKGMLNKPVSLLEFTDKVKAVLNVERVIYSGSLDKEIKKVAILGGGGGSFIGECRDCDVLLTGEAKYHEYQMSAEMGVPIVSAGHFETENITLYKIRKWLTDMGITIIDGDIHKSFSYII